MNLLKKILCFKYLWISLIIVGLGVIISWRFFEKPEETEVKKKIKEIETIVFGEWEPESLREILGTVKRKKETDIMSEVPGTVAKIFVDIGDEVSEGQILAIYKKIDDKTNINYENAVRTLNTTKISANNSIQSAEISLVTAEVELEQVKELESQNFKKAFDELYTRAQNAGVLLNNSIDWVDQFVGVSDQFQTDMYFVQHNVGDNNFVKKQATKNKTEDIILKRRNSNTLSHFNITDATILDFAKEQLEFLIYAKEIVLDMDTLIRETYVYNSFPEQSRAKFISEAENFTSKLNAEILSLETTLEGTKSQDKGINQKIITAENKVKNLEAALELAKSNAENHISTAKNQLFIAQSSKNDLEIKAPFDGKIFAKEISVGNQIKTGQKLFSIANENTSVKIVSFLSQVEAERINNKSEIKIKLPNDKIIISKEKFLSPKLDPMNQKLKAEFIIEKDNFPADIVNGTFVKILVPIQNGHKNLLPISAVSFEPDGNEILWINKENKTVRKKISTGEIFYDAITILENLDSGTRIVKYRNHAYAGEKISIKK